MGESRHQISVRPNVEGFQPYSPGLSIAEIKERYGLSYAIKLASNENPLGTSPAVVRTIERWAEAVFRYPQAGSPELRRALADWHTCSPDTIVVGNGSDEIIDLLLRVKPEPGRNNIVIFEPSFSIYRLQASLCGLEIRTVPVNQDLSLPLRSLSEAADSRTSCVFVTNPDNPSGYAASAEAILELAGSLPPDCLLVVDEAYVDFAAEPSRHSLLPYVEPQGNIAVLRTFSKIYGLAGLRVGYGVMPAGLADMLLRVKLPFSLNLLAEKAALSALEDPAFLEATRDAVLQGRSFLADELERLHCRPYPSQANFICFAPPAAPRRVFEALLSQGIIIRPLDSYGLTDHLRVSVGRSDENRAFILALEDILQNHE
jgi:histidinol-phosphate aminotransferase